MSTTFDTSQDPIGPCGPLEQSGRHSLMAAWISSVFFGDHPVVEYYRGYTVGYVQGNIRLMVRVLARVQVPGLGSSGCKGLG